MIGIITGASSGLGKEYVDALIKLFPEIDEIWLIARRKEKLMQVANKYKDKHFIILPLDLTDRKSYKTLEDELIKNKAQIKVLINNAGISSGGYFEHAKLESLLNMIDLNCKANIAITKLCLPYIIDKGTILEVSSTSAFVPNTNLVVYSATKSFVSAFSTGLRQELKSKHINVCAMCPGFMHTEMTRNNKNNLPVIDTKIAAYNSLKAAKKGRAVYTTGIFYKCYRLIAKIIPHVLLVKMVGLK